MEHQHPKSGNTVRGEKILPGTILLPTDVYASHNGEWEECPCAGAELRTTETLWVRPEQSKEPLPEQSTKANWQIGEDPAASWDNP